MEYTDADRLFARMLGQPDNPKVLELGRRLRRANEQPEVIQKLVAKGIEQIVSSAEEEQKRRVA